MGRAWRACRFAILAVWLVYVWVRKKPPLRAACEKNLLNPKPYFRRRNSNKAAAPKPPSASVVGSGTGARDWRTKPLKPVEPIPVEALTTVVSFELPPAKAGVKLVPADNPAELIRLLHEEAKAF